MTDYQTPAERRILADFPQAAINAMQAKADAPPRPTTLDGSPPDPRTFYYPIAQKETGQ